MRNSELSVNKKAHYYRVLICLIACFSCGILDAYTLFFKGFFGMLQTGNLVNSMFYLVNGQFEFLLVYIPVTLSFLFGLFVSNIIETKCDKKVIHSPTILTFLAIIILLIIICIPSSFEVSNGNVDFHKLDWQNILADCLFAVLGAFLFKSYSRLDAAHFTSTMMTANLARMVNSIYLGIVKKDKLERQKALDYIAIIFCFLVGVATFTLFYKFSFMENYSESILGNYFPNMILLLPFLLILIILSLTYLIAVEERKNRKLL